MDININDVNEIWCRILEKESIDNDTKFYDLGGNSVMFLIILEEIRMKYDVELPIEEFTEFETVTEMYKYILDMKK